MDAEASKGRAWELAARTLRSTNFKIAVVVFLLTCIASYLVLSRWGTAIAGGHGAHGFLYVPCRWEAYEDNRALETLHYVLVAFYYPVWVVDHHVFGGPHWSHIPMFHMGGPPQPTSTP